MSGHGTKHVGVRREGREWIAYDRETQSRIGPLHPSRWEAQSYAERRQETTYDDLGIAYVGMTQSEYALARHTALYPPVEPSDDGTYDVDGNR